MQERHTNPKQYFEELAETSAKFYIPYISQFMELSSNTRILEIGCGEGGNLVPFAQLGCDVCGVDISGSKIDAGRSLFAELGLKATFIASDIFKVKELENHFDLILVHDVIEHILDKDRFFADMKRYLSPTGIAFFGFPAWQMPFGGHQQVCRSKMISHIPFIHLLPKFIYRPLLTIAGEEKDTISEMLEIKDTRTPIELFNKLIKRHEYEIVDKKYYFINPHYEAKFGLRPRLLAKPIGKIPYVRNFFTTSCFYVIK